MDEIATELARGARGTLQTLLECETEDEFVAAVARTLGELSGAEVTALAADAVAMLWWLQRGGDGS